MDLGIPQKPRFLILFSSFVFQLRYVDRLGDRYLLFFYSRFAIMTSFSPPPAFVLLLLSLVPMLHADPHYHYPFLSFPSSFTHGRVDRVFLISYLASFVRTCALCHGYLLGFVPTH